MPRQPKPWFWTQRGVWCCTIQGTRHVLAPGKENKKAATDEFHRLMASLGQGTSAPSRRTTFSEMADLFLEDVCRKVERGERAAITYEGYVRFLSSAAERLGSARVTDLTPHAVLAWCEAPALKWGPTTRANAITAVKAMTRWARKRGLTEKDPLVDLEKPTRRKRKAVMTDDQVRAILEAMKGTPFADLIFGLWESGGRPNELVTLTADRVDVDLGTWTVLNKTRSSTGEEYRDIHLTPALIEMSRRLLARHPEGLIFRNARGRPWTRNAQACAWARLRKKLGFGPEATSYAIRHRYAQQALEMGLSSSDVAAMMGHTDTKMVDTVYGGWHLQKDRLKAAVRRVRPGVQPPDPAEDDGGSPGPSQPPPSGQPPDDP